MIDIFTIIYCNIFAMKFNFLQKSLIASFCLLLFYSQLNAQLVGTPNLTAQQLVDILVGPGVSTSNATLVCNTNGSGKFAGPSNLGIDSGIVLCTGRIDNAPGINGIGTPASEQMTTIANTAGDPDLNAISASFNMASTNDACVLEFDFIPKGDTVRFNYVFGSEEYPEYACATVNDVFALLISGPGIVSNTPMPTKRNVALIPGTNTPIMINTIASGPGIFGDLPNCTGIDASAPFTQYYIDNVTGQTVVFDGFTTVMTAEAIVTPCETYRLKLAIANVSDGIYDSGIFFKAGSLTSTAVATLPTSGLGANTNKLHTVRGCTPAEIQYKRTDCDTMLPFTFHLEIGGTAVPGVHYEPIPNTLPVPPGQSTASLQIKGLLGPYSGEKYVVIGIKHPDSVLVGASIIPIIQRDTVYIYDSLYINIPTPPTTVCPNTTITIQGETAPGCDFSWDPVAYNNGSLTITPNMLTTRIFTLKVTQPNAPATCPPAYRSYLATVEQIPIIQMPTDTTICLADSVPIPVMVSPDSLIYNYKWTPATGLRADNIGTNFFYAPPGLYNYTLRVTTPVAGCYSEKNLNLTAVLPEKFTSVLPQSGSTYNYDETIDFRVAGNFIFYTWEPSHLFVDPFLQNNSVKAHENTTYKVIGTDKYGCKDTASIDINVIYPHKPIMPNAFTPNGDGRNDVFTIPGNQFIKLTKFQVFNRWGQEMFSTIDPKKGWDGTFKGQPSPQGVYMYIVVAELPNKEIVTYKGDVTLIR